MAVTHRIQFFDKISNGGLENPIHHITDLWEAAKDEEEMEEVEEVEEEQTRSSIRSNRLSKVMNGHSASICEYLQHKRMLNPHHSLHTRHTQQHVYECVKAPPDMIVQCSRHHQEPVYMSPGTAERIG